MRVRVEDAVRIPEAFEELSPAGFAAWIRLNDGEPRPGRAELAKLWGCSPGRADQLAKELERVGYIRTGKKAGKLRVELVKRALIAGGRFVVLAADAVPVKKLRSTPAVPIDPPELSAKESDAAAKKIQAVDISRMDGKRKARTRKKSPASRRPAKPPAKKISFPGFSPSEKELRGLLVILDRKGADRQKKGLERAIAESFGHTYRIYRLRIGKQRFDLVDKDLSVAATAGGLCLRKGITPEALIEYWADNVGRFTTMKFPSLAFLSSPKIVDEAACNAGSGAAPKIDSKFHSFTDENALDPRLRPGLEEAGFDLTEKGDRYLLSVQSAARSIAAGKDLHLSKSVRKLAGWAAKNIYSKG